jgi:FkbM family methyltransferase
MAPSQGWQRVIRFAQDAPRNPVGKQLARLARDLYLWRAPLPVDVQVGEMRLRCALRDNTGERKFVFTPWRFDALERGELAANLPRDGVFVDIGANIGIYTLTAALLMGGSGRVISFEPFPPAYARLTFNIDATRGHRADWPRLQALEIGISDREGPRVLRIDAGNLGGASIAGDARFARADSHDELEIRCKPLLAALDELAVDRIDVLKIDIEGAEDLALVPFLADADERCLPGRMIIENSDALWKRDLRGALSSRGYHAAARTRLNTIWAR